MSRNSASDGDVVDLVGIEMDDLEDEDTRADLGGQLAERRTAGQSYENRFESILRNYYDDEKTWWDAVEVLLKKDADFAEKVAAKAQADGEKPREQVILGAMVDLLLGMEGITVHKGLVHVLEENQESYPLEFMAIELLRCGADPNRERGHNGSTPLHLAIAANKLALVKKLLMRGARLETRDGYGYTPLVKAVKYSAPKEIVDLLLEHGADVHAVAEEEKTGLHFAAQNDDEDIMRSLFESGLSADVEDNDGWTPLHEAVYYGSEAAVEVLTEKGASVNARDHRRRTALHVAAEKGEEELITFLLDQKADPNIADLQGNTPLDLAAKNQHEAAFDLILTHSSASKEDDAAKKVLKKAMKPDRVKDDFVKEKITEMSPFSVINMFKAKKGGGSAEQHRYRFLKEFANKSNLKKSTKAIMDHFMIGKRCVNCEVIEADGKGRQPDEDDFNESSRSLLDVIVERNDKELALHPSIKALLDYKWKKFGRWLFFASFMVYAIRMLFFGLALLIAARPGLDNPGCYRNGWDIARGVCEGISLLFFIYMIFAELQNIISFPKKYFMDFTNYLQLLAVILPFLIIPFRAATTWCASTGGGYCVDPTLLPNAANASNLTLDINHACINASHVQWIFASLAYMANAILVMEFLALFRTTGVYVRILLRIIVSDMLKFTVIFITVLYIFVGSIYLAMRAGVTVNTSTGAIQSDLEVFSLQTLYPWHVVFTGFRILFESEDVFNGDYFANNDEGQYVGYQWFSIVLYLAFLFAVIVVLLNLLIAQMSDTYTKIQEDVEGVFALARARIIARLQRRKWMLCKETYRKRYFQKYIWTELTDEELKQEEKEEKAEERSAMIEHQMTRITKMTVEVNRKLVKNAVDSDKLKDDNEEYDDEYMEIYLS